MTRLIASLLISAAVFGWSAAVCAADKPAPAAAAKSLKPKDAAPVNAPAADPSASPGQESKDEAPKDKESGKGGSSLPVPRFVSLRTNPINLRTGPGTQYPVDWVYVRSHLPVEVIAEFDTWRRIRDPDGDEGWVHQSGLSSRRTAVVKGAAGTLRREATEAGSLVANLEPGVIVNVQRCPSDSGYCRVEVNGLQGWLKRDQIWGVYATEPVQ